MNVAGRALIWIAAGAVAWWPASSSAAATPVTVPAGSAVTVPSLTVPNLTVPSVTVPAVTLPSVTLPSVTLPSATVPPLTLPSTEPSVSAPPVATSVPSPSMSPSPSTVTPAVTPADPERANTGAQPAPHHATMHLAVQTARAFGLPFTVAAAALAFLIVQARIDRNDPKLVDAPVTFDEDMVWFR